MSEPDRPDDWASASPDEQRAATRLRDALEGGTPHPDLDLVLSIRAATRPRPIPRARHEAVVRRALHPGRRAYGFLGAAGAVALAAAAALVLWRIEPPLTPVAIRSRSAADLFEAEFPVTGGTSERVDRIAKARQRELRDNLFAGWENR